MGGDGGYDDDDEDAEYGRGRSASVASVRDFVNGAYDLAAFDRDALLTPQEMLSQLAVDSEAGGGAGAWVPLSQQDGVSAIGGGGLGNARLGLHRLQKEHTFFLGTARSSASQQSEKTTKSSGKDLKTLAAASSTADAYSFVQEFLAVAAKGSIPMGTVARTTTTRRENLEKPASVLRELFNLRLAEQMARDNGLLLPQRHD